MILNGFDLIFQFTHNYGWERRSLALGILFVLSEEADVEYVVYPQPGWEVQLRRYWINHPCNCERSNEPWKEFPCRTRNHG